MAPFRLATVDYLGREHTALVLGERPIPIARLAPERPELHGGLFALLQRWDDVWPAVRQVARAAAESGLPEEAEPVPRVVAPVQFPRAIFCARLNYADLLADLGLPTVDRSGGRPVFVLKPPHCVVGPDEPIVLPDRDPPVDWGVALAAVIGRRCRGVFARDALDYVAGYTIVNDLSIHDGARPGWPDFGPGRLAAECFDTAAPMGPYLLPREFLPDPSRVRLRLDRSGKRQQDGSTAMMIFTLQEQIEYLSSFLTLQPGDVVATGTPAGVGLPRNQRLHAGDEVICTVDEIGTLRNPVIGPLTMVPPGLQGTAFA